MIRNLNIPNNDHLSGPMKLLSGESLTINIDNSMSVDSINGIINSVSKYVPYGSSLIFQFADGTYTLTSPLYFNGFFGGGDIYILGNSSDNSLSTTKAVYLDFTTDGTNGIDIRNNDCYFYVYYLKIKKATNSAWDSSIYVANTLFCKIFYNYVLGTGTTYGILIKGEYGTYLWTYNNYVSNAKYGLMGQRAGILFSHVNDDTGTMPVYGAAANQSALQYTSTQPAGSAASTYNNNGWKWT